MDSFLKNTNEYEIKHDSFLVDTLFLALTSNHKSILGSIILSFVFMECVFHANGLLQFIVQFGGNSPIIVTIGLLLLYIPYSILFFPSNTMDHKLLQATVIHFNEKCSKTLI